MFGVRAGHQIQTGFKGPFIFLITLLQQFFLGFKRIGRGKTDISKTAFISFFDDFIFTEHFSIPHLCFILRRRMHRGGDIFHGLRQDDSKNFLFV